MTEAFRQGMAEALQVPPSDISESTELGEGWDSVAVLTAIALIDQQFGKLVSAGELEHCRTVGEILRLAESTSS